MATGYWFHNWADTNLPIKIINTARQLIKLSVPKPPYGIKTGQRVFIQNVLIELDQPGEWYLNIDSGTLYIWPLETSKELEVEASLLDKLLVIDNAHHIILNNLAFQSSRGDAITVQGGHQINIAHSTIRNIDNRAAVISGQDNGLTENIG